MKQPFFWIAARRTAFELPPVEQALREPDGLLAAGGDLDPRTLLEAYRRGVFPWYEQGQPPLWWSPDPRTVLFPESLKVSRSLRKRLRQGRFEVVFDRAFGEVIRACAAPRAPGAGTWLTADMVAAYERLHRAGHAHSVECRREGELVGGLYGVALGGVFFGESMFSRVSDASKVALVHLVEEVSRRGFRLIDCQVYSPHLESLGARSIPRSEFLALLAEHGQAGAPPGRWDTDVLRAK